MAIALRRTLLEKPNAPCVFDRRRLDLTNGIRGYTNKVRLAFGNGFAERGLKIIRMILGDRFFVGRRRSRPFFSRIGVKSWTQLL